MTFAFLPNSQLRVVVAQGVAKVLSEALPAGYLAHQDQRKGPWTPGLPIPPSTHTHTQTHTQTHTNTHTCRERRSHRLVKTPEHWFSSCSRNWDSFISEIAVAVIVQRVRGRMAGQKGKEMKKSKKFSRRSQGRGAVCVKKENQRKGGRGSGCIEQPKARCVLWPSSREPITVGL